MRRTLLIGALGVVALASAAPTYAAQTETTVFILNHDQSVGSSWYGTVESEKTKCVDDRRVVLFRKRNNGSKVRIGSDRSQAPSPTAGVWDILEEDPRNGRYFASAPAIDGCAAGRSKLFRYPADNQARR